MDRPTPDLGSSAELIARQLFFDAEQRREQLGAVFLACQDALERFPEECSAAQAQDRLQDFLLHAVQEELQPERGERVSGGWLGAFMDGAARPIEAGAPDNTDTNALDLCGRALQRAESIAANEGNTTLLRNLGWYRQRLAHRSYDAIAQAEDRVAATIRTGVARARKYLLRVVHELQNAQPAPLTGEAPGELEPLRLLWVAQDSDRLQAELERTRAEFGQNPHWLNLAGLVAADRSERETAIELFERGLVHADAPSVRARLLNNLGNLFDELSEEGEALWRRAHQLLPAAPAPLMNLVAAASVRRDYAAAQLYLAETSDLLGSGQLGKDERDYVLRRLDENPKLGWLRDTDAWRAGPARWIKAASKVGKTRTLARRAVEVASAVALALLLLLPGVSAADAPRFAEHSSSRPTASKVLEPSLIARSPRGGDSMGKPPRRASERQLVAGDSMGRSSGGDDSRRPRPRG